ncbi:shikimate dehydrogenase [Aquipuribacter sp. MA13-6]|uniref:shikimate dehydrogenase n=1 Tax=unclassified Aquipuribacter TaxID=2635084 RepID=UPI003EE95C7A
MSDEVVGRDAVGRVEGPRRAAVLGHPVAHSLSPVLHRAAYAALGLAGWTYDAVDVDEAVLPGFVASLDDDWAGLSLTMPLKQAVLPLLDELDEAATVTGACNTVVLRAGRRAGANTDVDGMVAALAEVDPRAAAGGLPVAHVLGGGATAASAVLALRRTGCPAPVVHVRDRNRAGAVLAAAQRCGSAVDLQPWPDRPELAAALAAADVVVSTTPAGSTDAVAAALPAGVVGVLLDVAYEPWPSQLAAAWERSGGAVAPGSLMLLHQAAEQVRLMTGRPAPRAPMRVALAEVRPEILLRGQGR